MSARTATVERNTSETSITCTIDLDHIPGETKQVIEVSTGIGFLDHVSEVSLPYSSDVSRSRPALIDRCSQHWPSMEACL